MNHSTTSRRCRRCMLRTDQTRWTVGDAATGTGDARVGRMEQRTRRELDVHLDPVLLDQLQDE